MMRVLDLFSGIGGFSLGLHRAGGFRTVAFCEIEPYARAVLAKHWPGVPCYDDVRAINSERLAADGISVDVVCGGFPCQDISLAGKGAGLVGERSGLWHEMLRIIAETRPRWVIAENVAALRSRGLDEVLRGLASVGYDAEWHCIPASAVGAPHRRDRIWIVGYARGVGRHPKRHNHTEHDRPQLGATGSDAGFLADAPRELLQRRWAIAEQARRHEPADGGWWVVEPGMGRMAHGVPRRVDRLRCLGNAVVPQIPEMIGRAILAAELGRIDADARTAP